MQLLLSLGSRFMLRYAIFILVNYICKILNIAENVQTTFLEFIYSMPMIHLDLRFPVSFVNV